jgi:hypothetical protein
MERAVGSLFTRPLLNHLAVRQLPVGQPDGHVLPAGGELILLSRPAKEAEHGFTYAFCQLRR